MCLQIDDRNKESLEFAGRFSSIIPKNVMFQKKDSNCQLFPEEQIGNLKRLLY